MCFNYEEAENEAYNQERNMIFSLGIIHRK